MSYYSICIIMMNMLPIVLAAWGGRGRRRRHNIVVPLSHMELCRWVGAITYATKLLQLSVDNRQYEVIITKCQ